MGIEKRISKAWLRVDGELYECVAGSIKFNPGGEERTTVFSDQGVAGWTSKARAMSCEGSVLVGGAHDIPGFGKGEGCSLTLRGQKTFREPGGSPLRSFCAGWALCLPAQKGGEESPGSAGQDAG